MIKTKMLLEIPTTEEEEFEVKFYPLDKITAASEFTKKMGHTLYTVTHEGGGYYLQKGESNYNAIGFVVLDADYGDDVPINDNMEFFMSEPYEDGDMEGQKGDICRQCHKVKFEDKLLRGFVCGKCEAENVHKRKTGNAVPMVKYNINNLGDLKRLLLSVPNSETIDYTNIDEVSISIAIANEGLTCNIVAIQEIEAGHLVLVTDKPQ